MILLKVHLGIQNEPLNLQLNSNGNWEHV